MQWQGNHTELPNIRKFRNRVQQIVPSYKPVRRENPVKQKFSGFPLQKYHPDNISNNDTSGHFGKIETMGTLASQAEIDVWVKPPGGASVGIRGVTPGKIFRLCTQNPAIWCILDGKWFALTSIMHSKITLTMGKPFPRILPRNDS